MSLEQQVSSLVSAANNLTGTVNNKVNEINQTMDKALSDFNLWKESTSFVQKYVVDYAEDYYTDSQSGNYHVIQLYIVKDNVSAVNPWIHIGYTGGNLVGAAQFCSLAQTHADYTGQQAMLVQRGGGDIRFFIDRRNQYHAPVYMAVKNNKSNNAHVRCQFASYMALNILSMGAKNITTWMASNSSLEELTLIDITIQPVEV